MIKESSNERSGPSLLAVDRLQTVVVGPDSRRFHRRSNPGANANLLAQGEGGLQSHRLVYIW